MFNAIKAPDQIAAEAAAAAREARIAKLKQMLRDTDYVALSDYDKDKPELIAQRASWRAEIRTLEEH
jgi:hypothetical protein